MISLKKYLRNGVASSTLISASAVFIQLLLIAYLARVDTTLVGLLGVVELSIAWLLAVLYFGGEQYYLNVKNKKGVNKLSITGFHFFYSLILAIFLVTVYFLTDIDISIEYSLLEEMLILSIAIMIVWVAILVSALRGELKLTLAITLEKSFPVISAIILCLYSLCAAGDGEHINAIYLLVIFSFLILVFTVKLVFFGADTPKSDVHLKFKSYFSKEGLFFYATALLILVFERVDQLVVLKHFGLNELAGYYACYKLAFAVRFITKTINIAVYPLMSRYANDLGDELALVTSDIKVLNFIIAISLCIPMFLFSELIIEVIFGEKFLVYKSVLELMTIALLISTSNQVDFNYLNSKGLSRYFFSNSVLTVSVQLLTIYFTYEYYGISSLAYARVFSVFAGYFYAYLLMKRFAADIKRYLIIDIICVASFLLATSRVVL